MQQRTVGMVIGAGFGVLAILAMFSLSEPTRRQVSVVDAFGREGVLIPEVSDSRVWLRTAPAATTAVGLAPDWIEIGGRHEAKIFLVLHSAKIRKAWLGPEIHAWTPDTPQARIVLGIDPRPPPPPPRPPRKPRLGAPQPATTPGQIR